MKSIGFFIDISKIGAQTLTDALSISYLYYLPSADKKIRYSTISKHVWPSECIPSTGHPLQHMHQRVHSAGVCRPCRVLFLASMYGDARDLLLSTGLAPCTVRRTAHCHYYACCCLLVCLR